MGRALAVDCAVFFLVIRRLCERMIVQLVVDGAGFFFTVYLYINTHTCLRRIALFAVDCAVLFYSLFIKTPVCSVLSSVLTRSGGN